MIVPWLDSARPGHLADTEARCRRCGSWSALVLDPAGFRCRSQRDCARNRDGSRR